MGQSRQIGSLSVSTVGIGCNNFGSRLDAAQTRLVVDAAIDAGINFFDTADIYGEARSEEYLGRALGVRRGQVLIATKFGLALDDERKGAKPAYVKRAVEDSLRRLGTDYIDLYQLHRPDPEVPIADTLGALHELVLAGKVRQIGCSNFTAEQLKASSKVARSSKFTPFVSVQNEYSLLTREVEANVLPAAERLSVAFLPYFPLASGLLSGKYQAGRPLPEGTRLSSPTSRLRDRFLSEENLAIVERLDAFARARGRSLLELAFSWLLSQRAVASVIAGASTPAQVSANANAAQWELTAEDLRHISELAPVRPSPPRIGRR
jgi:aryl-alcohol dehydrogenase-like predicted oxidoreductase